jgi:hypothetical protein
MKENGKIENGKIMEKNAPSTTYGCISTGDTRKENS